MERLWGICNTPLPCYRKTYWFFEIQCRDVLHTPYQTTSQGWRMRKTWYVFYFHHVPGQFPRPRQRPWFSFAFFSCIKTRKEGRGMGAKPPIFISQDQYIRKMNRVSIIHRIWISKTWCVFGLLDHYNLKNWRVFRIRYPWDGVRWGVCNTPLHEISKNQRVFW